MPSQFFTFFITVTCSVNLILIFLLLGLFDILYTKCEPVVKSVYSVALDEGELDRRLKSTKDGGVGDSWRDISDEDILEGEEGV